MYYLRSIVSKIDTGRIVEPAWVVKEWCWVSTRNHRTNKSAEGYVSKYPVIQSVVDKCLLPLAFARDALRRYNPFGDRNRSKFARRAWLGGVRKFAQVNHSLYIGSTPSRRGLQHLRKFGIKTLINLRAGLDYRSEAEALGFKYVIIPLNGKRPPAEEQMVEFLKVVKDPENMPAFIHCNRAKNRTFMLLGLYRIAHDGWAADEAVAEMSHFGWKRIPQEVTSFLEDFSNNGLKDL